MARRAQCDWTAPLRGVGDQRHRDALDATSLRWRLNLSLRGVIILFVIYFIKQVDDALPRALCECIFIRDQRLENMRV